MLDLHVLCIFESKSLDHFRSNVIKLPLIPEHSSLRLCFAWQVIFIISVPVTIGYFKVLF